MTSVEPCVAREISQRHMGNAPTDAIFGSSQKGNLLVRRKRKEAVVLFPPSHTNRLGESNELIIVGRRIVFESVGLYGGWGAGGA